ncbi:MULTISPECIES: phospholipase D family protein [unclassified Dyella]|uniref:phospholipase D-like domain-containing protein n=1 Tax=Dyella sp. TaxID=1869338 RepID=UPI001E5CD7D6|nr:MULTISPECIES: phospholipase D family protein [unclassified Dyella]MDR3446715.1 phospholipase D family protein [Dyella sp.]
MGVALTDCSSLSKDFIKQPTSALPAISDTPSARYIGVELAQHPGQSGFRLLTKSSNALMSRIAIIDQARHSIDMQYYIFKNDATGRLVAQHVLAAADRGVRVRMLLDAMDLTNEDRMLGALDAHPSIQVRLFNPFRTRAPSTPSKIRQFIVEGRRLNRRMHNKSLVVDGTVAIIGGRNIGNDYFDASDETNFRDVDLIAIGPVVQQASHSFDAYWNCDAAYPVRAFREAHDTQDDLAKLRVALARDARSFARSDYAEAVSEAFPEGPTSDRRGDWFWGGAELVSDSPDKINMHGDMPTFRIGPKLKAMIAGAREEVLLISPYFVPGRDGSQFLVGIAERGIRVKVLTNSLASNDEPAAYSGYARYRTRLLEGGVALYELRPNQGVAQRITARGQSSGISLHAKAMVVDGEHVFIGSLNMDQRSKLLNTEMGLIVDSVPLASAVEQFFDTATLPENAFHVVLRQVPEGVGYPWQMRWLYSDKGVGLDADSEPGATRGRRVEVLVLQMLPLDSML